MEKRHFQDIKGLGTFTCYVLIFGKLLENILQQNKEKRKRKISDPGNKEITQRTRKGSSNVTCCGAR